MKCAFIVKPWRLQMDLNMSACYTLRGVAMQRTVSPGTLSNHLPSAWRQVAGQVDKH